MATVIVFILVIAAMGGAILFIDIQRWYRLRRLASARRDAHEADAGVPTVTHEATDVLEAYVLDDRKVRYACGHDYAVLFGHDFYGERLDVSDQYAAKREKCGDCMLAEIRPLLIRCCHCGRAIMPGEPVAAYGDNGMFRKEWCTGLPDSDAVLGCMRWNCCPSGGFFAGHWSVRGFVPAFPGKANLMAEVLAVGKPVVVSVGDGRAKVTVLDDKKGKDGGDDR